MGIASYGMLAEMLHAGTRRRVPCQGTRNGCKWKEMAADGDHYRLIVRQTRHLEPEVPTPSGTNCRTEISDPEIARTEPAYYHTRKNAYGPPGSTTAGPTPRPTGSCGPSSSTRLGEFEQFIEPVYRFMNETTDRVLMSDCLHRHPCGRSDSRPVPTSEATSSRCSKENFN